MIILSSEYEYNFELYGIISPLKESKMTYLIEKFFNIELPKQEDIKIEFLNFNNLEISNYLYQERYANFRLLRNKSWFTTEKTNYIVPEMKQFDFLLLLNGDVLEMSETELINEIKKIEYIQLVQKFDIEKLKSKENLIFE